MSIDKLILNVEDCQACRRCCRFDPDEMEDAPTFNDKQKERAMRDFAEADIRFQQRGKLWQIMLQKIPGQEKYICPVFDAASARCRVYDYDIFDCRTWPYYIMRKDGRIVMTLSPDCPVVNEKDREMLVRFAKETIGPRMIEAVKQNPDLITDYHGNAIILFQIEDL